MKSSTADPLVVLARITKSSKAYYQLLNEGPGPEHFTVFLGMLPEGLRTYYQQKGFEGSRRSVLFRRFVLEQAGRRMDAFLKERLAASEFEFWQEQDNYQKNLLFSLKESA